jgi:general secretion pathway protein D
MSSTIRRVKSAIAVAGSILMAVTLAGCAYSSAMNKGEKAEYLRDYDQAVVEFTKAVRLNPDSAGARQGLQRAKVHAAEEHLIRGRRLAALNKLDEAAVEYGVAADLNPASTVIDEELKATRAKLRTRVSVMHEGKTELQTLIDRTRDLPPPGLDLPTDVRMPASLTFRDAGSRDVFTTIARFGGIGVVFDTQFRNEPVSVDLRNASLENALSTVAAATRTFFRVTAPQTVVIVPDTPTKRREYEEEIVRTFYLSNADLKETLDLLRVVLDARRVSPITANNAIAIKDTPERVAAAARLITAIDKARPEIIVDVELLEIDRTRMLEYGLQVASPGSPGINGSVTVAADANQTLTLETLKNLSAKDILLTNLPGLYYRLLKSDSNTRTLANPQLRSSEGITASAKFGDQIPIPVTTFSPIATGGVPQQPVTSYNYQNVGVNIDITPRTHHDADITLQLNIAVTAVSGTGFGGLPTLANREIKNQIRLRDGETSMLAGLIRDDERKSLDGIPGLSDLPWAGKFFAHSTKSTNQTDIVLTLTPHIVRVLDLSESDLRPFRVSRDTVAPGSDFPSSLLPPPPVPAEVAPPAAPGANPPSPNAPPPTEGPTPTVRPIPIPGR